MSKNMNLLMENWRKFLNEDEATNAKIRNQYGQAAQQLQTFVDQEFDSPVPEFRDKLNALLKTNPKVQVALKLGQKDGLPEDEKISVTDTSVPVKSLLPTQNEIAYAQSLGGPFGPLQKVDVLSAFLAGGAVTVKGKPGSTNPVTAEGKYIIDGHHRWSSLFLINSDASLNVVDLKSPKLAADPMKYLKVTHMAIGADVGKLPDAKAGGINLLDSSVSFEQLKQAIEKDINAGANKEAVLQAFAKSGQKDINQIAQRIYKNLEIMRAGNQPVANAPPRVSMPQTDDTKGRYKDILSTGILNYIDPKKAVTSAAPVQKESLEKIVRQVIRENLKRK